MSRWSAVPADALLEKQEWLSSDGEKIVICDIVYHDGTVSAPAVGYFSNYPYITPYDENFTDLLDDTVNNIAYIDNLVNIPSIISKIDSDVNIGAIEFLNADGEFDDFIAYAWEGWPLKIYIGGKDWLRNDFILILEAISSVISSPRPNIMSLGIRDKKEVFNVKAQRALIDNAYVTALYADYLADTGSEAFTETVQNLISLATAVEVKLNTNIPLTDILIANATNVAIAALPEFTTSPIGSAAITITQTLTGTYEAAHDGEAPAAPDPTRNDNFDTLFTFAAPIGADQVITVTVNPAGLNGTYFHIHSPYKQYYIWYNVDNGSSDPELIEHEEVLFDKTAFRIPDTILNTPVPICLGKCFNIEPKLIDSTNHVYQVHEGQINSVLEVRSNGIVLDGPLSLKPQYEVRVELGCFRLLVHQNSTQITCDILGAPNRGTGYNASINIEPYSAAQMVEWLALEKTALTSTDICPGTFDKSSFTNISPLGLYIKDEIDVAPLVTDIMASVGGFARFDRLCTLQIFRLEDPELGTSVYTIDDDLIIEKGLSLALTEVPKATITLGSDKNWTVQDKGSLAGLLSDPAQDFLHLLDLYSNEYTTVISDNSSIKSQYPLAEDKALVGTLISDFGTVPTTNAQDEVDRRMGLRETKRYVYKIDSTVAPFTLSIGDIITVYHSRFGFSTGKQCIIIGMDEKPTKLRVTLEVWL